MKIETAMQLRNSVGKLESLAVLKTRSRPDVIKMIFAQADAPEEGRTMWSGQWLPSDRFHLVRIPLNLLASPHTDGQENRVLSLMASDAIEPIIADVNVQKLSRSKFYVPSVIVVAGNDQFHASLRKGDVMADVWLGEKTLNNLGIEIYAHCAKVTKDGAEHDVAQLHALFRKQNPNPKIHASAPEGWEETVEKMKDHSEIDNPFALAHWMKQQGYSPKVKAGAVAAAEEAVPRQPGQRGPVAEQIIKEIQKRGFAFTISLGAQDSWLYRDRVQNTEIVINRLGNWIYRDTAGEIARGAGWDALRFYINV